MRHQTKKRFGQHFLTDSAVIGAIIAAISPQADDHLVEIGPGQGALTTPLVASKATVTAVELDRDLWPLLQKRYPQLQLIAQDVLTVDFKTIANRMRVVGNLPYNISTPLIFHLLEQAEVISDMVFMLQKEVADRICADVSQSAYGRLSVMVQYACQTQWLFAVSAQAFSPPPKVESAVIRLIPYATLPHPAKDFATFEKLVRTAFNFRRKTLARALKGWVDATAFEKAEIDPSLRAENLSVAQFVALANQL